MQPDQLETALRQLICQVKKIQRPHLPSIDLSLPLKNISTAKNKITENIDQARTVLKRLNSLQDKSKNINMLLSVLCDFSYLKQLSKELQDDRLDEKKLLLTVRKITGLMPTLDSKLCPQLFANLQRKMAQIANKGNWALNFQILGFQITIQQLKKKIQAEVEALSGDSLTNFISLLTILTKNFVFLSEQKPAVKVKAIQMVLSSIKPSLNQLTKISQIDGLVTILNQWRRFFDYISAKLELGAKQQGQLQQVSSLEPMMQIASELGVLLANQQKNSFNKILNQTVFYSRIWNYQAGFCNKLKLSSTNLQELQQALQFVDKVCTVVKQSVISSIDSLSLVCIINTIYTSTHQLFQQYFIGAFQQLFSKSLTRNNHWLLLAILNCVDMVPDHMKSLCKQLQTHANKLLSSQNQTKTIQQIQRMLTTVNELCQNLMQKVIRTISNVNGSPSFKQLSEHVSKLMNNYSQLRKRPRSKMISCLVRTADQQGLNYIKRQKLTLPMVFQIEKEFNILKKVFERSQNTRQLSRLECWLQLLKVQSEQQVQRVLVSGGVSWQQSRCILQVRTDL